jgi:hypothetical protein
VGDAVMADDVLLAARRLMVQIMEKEASEPGTQSIEDLLEALLQLMRRNTTRRSGFVRELKDLILHPAPGQLMLAQPGITEILEYCMHELRWADSRRPGISRRRWFRSSVAPVGREGA